MKIIIIRIKFNRKFRSVKYLIIYFRIFLIRILIELLNILNRSLFENIKTVHLLFFLFLDGNRLN